MNAYLKQIQLNNYRSCIKTTIDLQPNLSTLIGVNGSGKSNVLHGITLLNKILHLRHYPDERGNEYLCKLKASFDINGKTLKYQSLVKYINSEKNIDGVIGSEEKWNFVEFNDDKTWINAPMMLLRDFGRKNFFSKQLAFIDEEGFPARYQLSRAIDVEIFNKKNFEKIAQPIESVHNLISGIVYYSASRFTDPSKCPTFFEIDSSRVARNNMVLRRPTGSNRSEHSQFMYDLYLSYKSGSPRYQEFLSIVGKGGIGLVDKIAYREVKAPSRKYEVYTGGKIVKREAASLLVIPTITIKNTRLSPNQLSEGTFKTLAIIFYLVTDQSRLLLLEEPEVCVHHGLLGSIMQLVKDFSEQKQIVISTHSDFVLDGLDPNNVFVVKYQPEKGTIVRHVPSAMSKRDYRALKEYLDSDGNLGEYWRHGDLENES